MWVNIINVVYVKEEKRVRGQTSEGDWITILHVEKYNQIARKQKENEVMWTE